MLHRREPIRFERSLQIDHVPATGPHEEGENWMVLGGKSLQPYRREIGGGRGSWFSVL